VTAISEALELERVLGRLLKEEEWLAEDIARSFPIRLFRQARKVGAEPVLESLFRGMGKALAEHPHLSDLMLRFDRAYEQALVRKVNRDVALKALSKERANWQSIKRALVAKDRGATEDLVTWIDRDLEERLAIVRKRAGRNRENIATPVRKPKSISTAALKTAKAEATQRAERARRVYAAFGDAMADSSPEEFPAFARLAAYLKHDDPVWGRIAEKLESAESTQIESAIQGVLGEALALRNTWVVDSIVQATGRAERLAAKLGSDWEVVFTQLPVLASTKGGGIGELYDASIWVVKKTKGIKGEVLEAAPVFVLQVKSGSVREAVAQTGTDFTREFGDIVRLPVAGKAAAERAATRDFRIQNLKELLTRQGVKPSKKGGFSELATQRILVAPRPPSAYSLRGKLPPGTAIEYVDAVMSKSELNYCTKRFTKTLKKK
jgi:hypothetical protein